MRWAGVAALDWRYALLLTMTYLIYLALSAWVGGLAYRRQREGWPGRAIGHTWRGALTMLILGLVLGAAIDHYLPAADSLLEALPLMRGEH